MTQKCSQCDTPAMKNNSLCVDCHFKLQQARTLEYARLAAPANQAVDDMENIAGLRPGSLGGRLPIPKPTTINAGQTTYNNIHVDNSVVGAINTGNIKKLDILLSAMRSNNNQELAHVLEALTHVILDTPDLRLSDKDSALEWLSFLSNQSLTQETERQSTIGKTAISTLEKILSNTGSIASIWSAAKPLLDALF